MTECSKIELATKEVRPVLRFLASVMALSCLGFVVTSWIWNFADRGLNSILFFIGILFGHIAFIAGGVTFGNSTMKLSTRLHRLAQLYVNDRMTLAEFGERIRKALHGAASLSWQKPRSLFRFWAYFTCALAVSAAIGSWVQNGLGHESAEWFFCAGLFLFLAEGGRFVTQDTDLRMRLHLLADLYVNDRMTLDRFGQQTHEWLEQYRFDRREADRIQI
jgi:hypothetical protein